MRCPMLAAFLDLCPAFGTLLDLQGDKCGWCHQDKQEYIPHAYLELCIPATPNKCGGYDVC